MGRTKKSLKVKPYQGPWHISGSWSDDELDYVIENINVYPRQILANHLKRTLSSIQSVIWIIKNEYPALVKKLEGK